MKRISTLFIGLSICSLVNAETVKTLTLGIGTPGLEEPQLVGQGISPNGKYVCGSLEMGQGYFIADLENNVYTYAMTEDPEGAELRHIDNNGLAIGYNGPGVTYSIEGVETILKAPADEYKYILGEAISNDGSVLVGSLVTKSWITHAAYSKDGGEWQQLPLPADELLGDHAGAGSAAKYVSGDGNIILGSIGNFGPAILWVANDKGEYEIDPLFSKYVIMNDADLETGEKTLFGLNPIDVSDNGKYAVLQGMVIADEAMKSVPAVYDIEAKQLTVYSEPQDIDTYGFGLMPTSISNDGTMVGIVGSMPMIESSGCFIWKAGEPNAESLSTAFPAYGEMFGFAESVGYCVPTSMSADGRYILGYGFYSTDFDDMEAPAYFLTFVIDIDGTTAIQAPDVENAEPAVVKDIYTIDGKRLDKMTNGINIIRMSDGTVKKVIK